jgi:genome maintenance exonuclease 1
MFTHLTPPNLPELQVTQSATGKRYYVTPEGNKYRSVTTMLGQKEKPAIKKWQMMLGDKAAKRETNRCANRGTAIHELAERYLNNEKNILKGVKPEYAAGFNQLKVRLNCIDNIRMQEAALYSDKLQLAGRVDCIGEYEGVLCVIDFKTSNNNKDLEMVEDYFLQCTAYAIMWFELTGEVIEDIVILMSVERGMVPLIFRGKIDKYVKPLLQRIQES